MKSHHRVTLRQLVAFVVCLSAAGTSMGAVLAHGALWDASTVPSNPRSQQAVQVSIARDAPHALQHYATRGSEVPAPRGPNTLLAELQAGPLGGVHDLHGGDATDNGVTMEAYIEALRAPKPAAPPVAIVHASVPLAGNPRPAPDAAPRHIARRPVANTDGTRAAVIDQYTGLAIIDNDEAETLDLGDAAGSVVVKAPPQEGRHLLLQGGRVARKSLTVGQDGGMLELDGTQFAIQQGVRIYPDGRIVTHIYGASAGLDLAKGARLDLAPGGQLVLYFHDTPTARGIHWGLRSRGDRRKEFHELIAAGRIIVAIIRDGGIAEAEPLIIFDGQYTYVTIKMPVHDRPINSTVRYLEAPAGYIPEPATVGLLGAAGIALLKPRRRRLR